MKNIVRDPKEDASHTFADVIRATANLFPEAAYRPTLIRDAEVNQRYGISAGKHKIFGNADGIGTKPEFAERLALATNSESFREVAMDGVAMVVDDVSRDGDFVVGIINSVDVNTADPRMVQALAQGMQKACELGRFPLWNGETAELGYRSPGYGDSHVNWNMTAVRLINKEKTIDGRTLKPGQPIVGFRETSIRSNGLTRARAILEQAYLAEQGMKRKQDWIAETVREELGLAFMEEVERNTQTLLAISMDDRVRELIDAHLRRRILDIFGATPLRQNIWEQIQLPWHETFRDITDQLRKPSTLYYPIIYNAQGGVDGEVNVPLVACAHISGGGIPLKAGRMLKQSGLGAHIDCPFPDPEGIPELMALAEQHPGPNGPLVNERTACEQWNRGIGFLAVAPDVSQANALVKLAAEHGREAAIVGETTKNPSIEWRGHSWNV